MPDQFFQDVQDSSLRDGSIGFWQWENNVNVHYDDVVITNFTSGPGSTTLPLYIFGQLKFGVSPSINALSTIVLLIALTLLAIAGVFSLRASKRGVGAIDAKTLG